MKDFRAVMATPLLVLGVILMGLGMSTRFGFNKANFWLDKEVELMTQLKGE
jgi:hypothetical protein